MNKVKAHRYNDKYNIIQKYTITNTSTTERKSLSATTLGYDVALADGTFIKSFDDFDLAVKWIENNAN